MCELDMTSISSLLRFFCKLKYPAHNLPLHRNENIVPFFIVGSGRSGNTLLRRILNNHSELFIPPETYVLGKSIKQYKSYPNLTWYDLVSLVYSNFEFHPEFETFGITSLGDITRKVQATPKESQSLALIFNAFYQNYKQKNVIKAARWGDKTPLNTFSVQELLEVFPKAQFIHIIRSPYDSIHSLVESGLQPDLDVACRRWMASVESAIQFGNNNQCCYREIAYENLVSHPEREVRALCEYLQIPFEATMLNRHPGDDSGDIKLRRHHHRVLKDIDENSVGKGLRALTEQELSSINAILKTSKFSRILELLQG